MQSIFRRSFLGLSTGALPALTGCSLFSARGVGMFRWTQLMDQAQRLNNVHIFTTTEAHKQALVKLLNQPVKEN